MSVYRPSDGITYRYDFQYRGRRYRGSTGHGLCGELRSVVGLLGDPTIGLWVCRDCQNKLARKVDDEGVPGG